MGRLRGRGLFRGRQHLIDTLSDDEPQVQFLEERRNGLDEACDLLNLLAINCLRHPEIYPYCPECTRWRNNRDLIYIVQKRLQSIKESDEGETGSMARKSTGGDGAEAGGTPGGGNPGNGRPKVDLDCSECGGERQVMENGAQRTCPHCNGTGKEPG